MIKDDNKPDYYFLLYRKDEQARREGRPQPIQQTRLHDLRQHHRKTHVSRRQIVIRLGQHAGAGDRVQPPASEWSTGTPPSIQKEFKIKHKQQDESNRRINDLLNKKQEIQGELDEIAKEEEKIHNLTHSRSERKYFKSEMTEEDIERIKKIKMQQKKHELEVEQRAKMHEEQMRRLQDEERELVERQQKEKNEERLRETAKKIEEIKRRQEERTKKIEEENRKIVELKHEKKLHEKLEEHYRTAEQ